MEAVEVQGQVVGRGMDAVSTKGTKNSIISRIIIIIVNGKIEGNLIYVISQSVVITLILEMNEDLKSIGSNDKK